MTEYNNQQQHLQNDENENGSGLTLHDLLQMVLANWYWFALSVLICLVALVGIVAPQREPVEVRPMAEAGSDALEHSLMVGCELLQKKFGLSDRESEIAFLLARGYSRPYIREKLFISKNTVATHIRHIYGKLDIHSKEELIDLATEAARK